MLDFARMTTVVQLRWWLRRRRRLPPPRWRRVIPVPAPEGGIGEQMDLELTVWTMRNR